MNHTNSEVAVPAAESPRGSFAANAVWWQYGTILLLLAFIYYGILPILLSIGMDDPDFCTDSLCRSFPLGCFGGPQAVGRHSGQAFVVGLVVIVGALGILIAACWVRSFFSRALRSSFCWPAW